MWLSALLVCLCTLLLPELVEGDEERQQGNDTSNTSNTSDLESIWFVNATDNTSDLESTWFVRRAPYGRNCSCGTDDIQVLNWSADLNSSVITSLAIANATNSIALSFAADSNSTEDDADINSSAPERRAGALELMMLMDNYTGPDNPNASNSTDFMTLVIAPNITNLTIEEEHLNVSNICNCEARMQVVNPSFLWDASELLFNGSNDSDDNASRFSSEHGQANVSNASAPSTTNVSVDNLEVLIHLSTYNSTSSNTSFALGVDGFAELVSNDSTITSTSSTSTMSTTSSFSTSSTASSTSLKAVIYVYGQLVFQLNISGGEAVNQSLLLDTPFQLTLRQSIANGLTEVLLEDVEILQVAFDRRLAEVVTDGEDVVEVRIAFRIRATFSNSDGDGAAAVVREMKNPSFVMKLLTYLEAKEAFTTQDAVTTLIGLTVENVQIVTMPRDPASMSSTTTVTLSMTATSTALTAAVIVTSTTSTSLWLNHTSLVPSVDRPEPDGNLGEDPENMWRAAEILPLALTLLAGLLLPCSLSSVVEEATSPSRLLSTCCARRVRWLQARTGLPPSAGSSGEHESLEQGYQRSIDGGHAPPLGQPMSRLSGATTRWRADLRGSCCAGPADTSPAWIVCQHGQQLLIEVADADHRDGPAAALSPTSWNEWRSLAGHVRVRYMTPTRLRVIRYDRKKRSHGNSGDGMTELLPQTHAGSASVPSPAMPSGAPPTQTLAAPVASGWAENQQRQGHHRSRGSSKKPLEGTLRRLAEAASTGLVLALDLSPLTQHILSVFGILELLAAGGALAVSTVARLGAVGLLAAGVLCLLSLMTCLLGQCKAPQQLALHFSAARFLVAPLPALCCASALFVAAALDEPHQAIVQVNAGIIDFTAGVAGVVSAMCALAFLLFESDCLGFLLVCILDSMAGMVAFAALAVAGWRGDQDGLFNFSALLDFEGWKPTEAGRLAALLLLIVLTIGRLAAAIALHPYMQPLRAPPTHLKAAVSGALAVDVRNLPSAAALQPAPEALLYPPQLARAPATPPAELSLPHRGQAESSPLEQPARWHGFNPPAATPPQPLAQSQQGFAHLFRQPLPIIAAPTVEPVRVDVHGFYSMAGEDVDAALGSDAAVSPGWLLDKERLGWPDSHLLRASPAPGGRFIRWTWCKQLSHQAPCETAAEQILPDLRAAAADLSPPPPPGAGTAAPAPPPPTPVRPQAASTLSPEVRPRAAEEARMSFEAEARLKAAEEASLRFEEDQRLQAEEEVRFRAEEKATLESQMREEEARLKAAEDARLKIEEEQRRKAEEEARFRAEEKARLEVQMRAEAEASLKAAEAERLKAEEEERHKAEEEERHKAEEEARFQAEEKARLEEAARLKAEEEETHKAEEKARLRAEEKARLEAYAEDEVRLKVEEDQRLKAEENAKWQAGLKKDELNFDEEAQPKAADEADIAAEEQAREQDVEDEQFSTSDERAARVEAIGNTGVVSEQKTISEGHTEAGLRAEEEIARLRREEVLGPSIDDEITELTDLARFDPENKATSRKHEEKQWNAHEEQHDISVELEEAIQLISADQEEVARVEELDKVSSKSSPDPTPRAEDKASFEAEEHATSKEAQCSAAGEASINAERAGSVAATEKPGLTPQEAVLQTRQEVLEKLRQQTRNALADASTTGKLDGLLAQMGSHPADESSMKALDCIRNNTLDLLTRASSSGSLANILGEAHLQAHHEADEREKSSLQEEVKSKAEQEASPKAQQQAQQEVAQEAGMNAQEQAALAIDIFSDPGDGEAPVMDSPWGVSDRQFNARFQQPMRFMMSPTSSSMSGPTSGREVLGSFACSSSWLGMSGALTEMSVNSARDSDFGLSENQLVQVAAFQRSVSQGISESSATIGCEAGSGPGLSADAAQALDNLKVTVMEVQEEEEHDEADDQTKQVRIEYRSVDEEEAGENMKMPSRMLGAVAVDML